LCQRFADECESRARQRGRDDGEARKLKRPSLRPALIVRSRAAAAFDSGRPSNEAESRTVRRRQYLFHRESIIRSKSGLETFAPDYTADDDVITVPQLDDAALCERAAGMDQRAARGHVKDTGVAPARACPQSGRKQDSTA
jgi:hypothetical protein